MEFKPPSSRKRWLTVAVATMLLAAILCVTLAPVALAAQGEQKYGGEANIVLPDLRQVSWGTITGQGLEFDCLTAALLGGVSFKGGEGTIFGLIVGIIIIGVLNNAMQLASFPDFSQTVVKGTVLLIAVAFDVYQKSRKAKKTVEKVTLAE